MRTRYSWMKYAEATLQEWKSCMPQADIEVRPILFTSFMTQDAEENPVYAPVPSFDILRSTLDSRLADHNESNAVMDLVLFQQVNPNFMLRVSHVATGQG